MTEGDPKSGAMDALLNELLYGRSKWPVPVAVGLIVAAMLAAMVMSDTPERSALRLCDAAIQRTLKAPSTYRRVTATGDEGSYWIEYDADNAFGVPIRGMGSCGISQGGAEWRDVSRS
jgi:hypothetical protein